MKQAIDDLTKILGSHTLKVGFNYQHINNPWKQPPEGHGYFSFDGSFTSVVNQTDGSTAIAQLLLAPAPGNNLAGANNVQFSGVAPHNTSRNYVGTYFQDDWKVSPKLTVNLGLRWDYFGAEEDRHGDQSNFVPGVPFSNATLLVTAARQNLFSDNFKAALAKDGIAFQVLNRLALFQAQKTNFARPDSSCAAAMASSTTASKRSEAVPTLARIFPSTSTKSSPTRIPSLQSLRITRSACSKTASPIFRLIPRTSASRA